MNPLYVVLEVVKVLERQRLPLTLRIIIYYLLRNAYIIRVYLIEVVKYYSKSIILKSPLFVR